MREDEKLDEFLESALKTGLPHGSLVGMLTAQGWPEREVYKGLSRHYALATGIKVPRRTGAGASAKEAFLYLLIFSTLAVWTINFGQLAFALIERHFPDPLFAGYGQYTRTEVIPSSLAAILIAFPIYLSLSRVVSRDLITQPERLESPVRKWLIYLALVIAAGILMGDLITVLAYMLRGEITSRFLLKSFVGLALSGAVLFYYLHGVRRTAADAGWKNFDRSMAIISTTAAGLIVILGFYNLGSPSVQRTERADRERISRLYVLSLNVKSYYDSHGKQLPTGFNEFAAGSYDDPLTHTPFEYHAQGGGKYELCAKFSHASGRGEDNSGLQVWIHGAGRTCFEKDATATVSPIPLYATY